MDQFNLSMFLMVMVALVLGITVHEFCHAIVADKLGDPLPRSQGRITLSPLAHLDPIGSIFMVVSALIGYGIGWGRPVQTNPNSYRINRRLGHVLVTIAGPLSNMVIAIVFALLFRTRILPPDQAYEMLVLRIIEINVYLFFFNLIPLYPLDGSHLLANSLPQPMAQDYYRFMAQWGNLIFIGLVLFRYHGESLLGMLIGPPATRVIVFLIGGY